MPVSTNGVTYPPADYRPPGWPSLFWPPLEDRYVLYRLGDMVRFTMFWTLVMYAAFHWAAVGIALFVQIGKRRTNWKYLWTVPIIYSVIAAFEALIAGTITGAMFVLILSTCLITTASSTDENLP
ncbi:hypothetical protein OPQ81_000103 [Rhizoctonia solani]|nr:hypothetical protein OPQ81_000103 [Rhizoctonia solani]